MKTKVFVGTNEELNPSFFLPAWDDYCNVSNDPYENKKDFRDYTSIYVIIYIIDDHLKNLIDIIYTNNIYLFVW